VASAVLPGWGQLLGGRRAAGWAMIATTGVSAVALAVWAATGGVRQATHDPDTLVWVAAGAVGFALLRAAVVIDAWRTGRFGRGGRAAAWVVLVAVLAVVLAPQAVLVRYASVQHHLITSVFTDREANVARPDLVDQPGEVATSSTTTIDEPIKLGEDGRWNVLLLGGDAGRDRVGLRTDTMVLASIELATGQVTTISVPRNLERMPFPDGPLHDAFPRGFNDLANAVYGWGTDHPDAFAKAVDPGAEAIKAGVSQLLGMPVHNFVLVDLAGFVKLVDAVGGVTIDVTEPVSLDGVGSVNGRKLPAEIGVGVQHMDGILALAYSRSRTGSDDYTRMRRQRCVLDALANQLDPATVITLYQQIASTLTENVSTDIPWASLDDVERLGGRLGRNDAVSLTLAPPLINPSDVDVEQVRLLAHAAVVRQEQTATTTTAVPGGGPDAGLDGGAVTTTTAPAGGVIEPLHSVCRAH
jgi:LCP family protein required for cell wall assembly